MKICKFCKEVSMKVIPDNGQSSANTSRKSNKTRTEENGAIANISTFMPKMQTCSRRSKVQNMSSEVYRSSQLRSTLNTGYITALDMCEVCTEAVHSVALWTLVTSQLWTCVKCEAVHSVALWTRVTSQLWTCVKYVPKQSTPYLVKL